MSAPYSEPSNEQLANFMTVLARRMPSFAHLAVSPAILEHIFETQPKYRELCLIKHRQFQEQADALAAKVQQGLLQCEFVLLSQKQCPNFNVPGSHFCGLHKELME